MINEKSVVVTVYGHGDVVDKFSAKMMADCDIEYYCDTINRLKLDGDSWACAKVISEDSHYWLEDFRPLTFDLILCLDDMAIQKVLRETDSQDLAKALRGVDPKISEAIFRNMSKRAVSMLKEDMKYMGPQPKEEIAKVQEQILNTISNMEQQGIIVTKKELI